MEGFKSFITEHWWPGLDQTYPNIDHRIVQLYTTGAKIREIEEQTGKWRSYIYGVLQREGLRPSRLNQARELTIQLAGSGVSINKIAEITYQTSRNVRGILSRHREQGVW